METETKAKTAAEVAAETAEEEANRLRGFVGKTFKEKGAASKTRRMVHEYVGAMVFTGKGLKHAFRIDQSNPNGCYFAPANDFLGSNEETKD